MQDQPCTKFSSLSPLGEAGWRHESDSVPSQASSPDRLRLNIFDKLSCLTVWNDNAQKQSSGFYQIFYCFIKNNFQLNWGKRYVNMQMYYFIAKNGNLFSADRIPCSTLGMKSISNISLIDNRSIKIAPQCFPKELFTSLMV